MGARRGGRRGVPGGPVGSVGSAGVHAGRQHPDGDRQRTALGGVQEGGWVVISIFTAVVCVIATLAALTARETKDVPTAELGGKSPKSAPELVNH